MSRCAVCGRLPDEEHCPRCHEVHDLLRECPIWTDDTFGNGIGLAKPKRRTAGNVVAVKKT